VKKGRARVKVLLHDQEGMSWSRLLYHCHVGYVEHDGMVLKDIWHSDFPGSYENEPPLP